MQAGRIERNDISSLPPIPEGWYFVASRQSILKARLIQKTWMGEEIVTWCGCKPGRSGNGRRRLSRELLRLQTVQPHPGAQGECVRSNRRHTRRRTGLLVRRNPHARRGGWPRLLALRGRSRDRYLLLGHGGAGRRAHGEVPGKRVGTPLPARAGRAPASRRPPPEVWRRRLAEFIAAGVDRICLQAECPWEEFEDQLDLIRTEILERRDEIHSMAESLGA